MPARCGEKRNAAKLAELRKACESRLARANGNNRGKIEEAKRAARGWQAAYLDEGIIAETSDSPARPVELPARR